MKITLFTVEQATKLARELTPEIQRLKRLHDEIRGAESRLEVMALTLAGASVGNPDADEARLLAARRNELAGEIRKGIAAAQGRGAVVKDLGLGLVDFYSLAGDRLIFLCWKLGEREVGHWHTLDGGYGSRQPLDRSPLED